MKQSSLMIGVLILAGATLLGGVVHGRMNRRWGGDPELQRLAEKLDGLPTDIGPWHFEETLHLSPSAEKELECAGYVSRRYENRKTRQTVTMALLLGPGQPIAAHTPDVCYSGGEYDTILSPEAVNFGSDAGPKSELWGTTLQSKRLDASFLRVYYGWSTGGEWSAPVHARYQFGGQPYLYKLQVAGELPSASDEKASDPCLSFIKALLPVVKQHLVESVKE